jgi:hypothetical protein
MDPLHLYVVCIVCGGRESHRGVFLKRALGPPILRKYAYRSRFRFRKCASSPPWRAERCPSLPKLCVATCIVAPKSGRPFQPLLTMRGESFRKCASFLFVPAPTARFCANRGRSPEFATRIFGNADTVGPRWRGVSDRQLNFPKMGGASRQLHNAHFRKNRGAHFRKWELPEGHPPRLGRIVEVA